MGSKMLKQAILSIDRPLLAIFLASAFAVSGAQSAPPQSSQNPTGKPAPAPAKPAGAAQSATPAQAVAPNHASASAGRPAPAWQGSQVTRLSRRAEMYYEGG